MLRSLNHLEFTFCVWYGMEIFFFFLLFTENQFSYYHLLNTHTLPLISETTSIIYRPQTTWVLCLWSLRSNPLICLLIPAPHPPFKLCQTLIFCVNLRTICQRGTQKSIGNFCEGHIEFIDQFGQSCYFKITRVFPSINMIYSVILTRPLKALILFF